MDVVFDLLKVVLTTLADEQMLFYLLHGLRGEAVKPVLFEYLDGRVFFQRHFLFSSECQKQAVPNRNYIFL
jgi:hypothetical protein